MLRQREPQQIRASAIAMGIKKARSGCLDCLDSYLNLARQYGATHKEIQQALTQIVQSDATTGTTLLQQRRHLLKWAAYATVLPLAYQFLAHTQSAAAHEATPPKTQKPHDDDLLWGTDSNTLSNDIMPQDFYIGRLGYGAQPNGNAQFFNVTAAQQAGKDRTFGYWGIVGPKLKPGGISDYNWGVKQAGCAWNSWHNGSHASYLGGLTIFGDLEPGFGGWQNGNYKANQAVLAGFLDQMHHLAPKSSVFPGLYISPLYWRSLIGEQYCPKTPFVLWLTGCHTCASSITSPGDSSGNTPDTIQTNLDAGVANVTIGGQRPVVWQYWISSCGAGDYNVMLQNSTILKPVAGDTNFVPCP